MLNFLSSKFSGSKPSTRISNWRFCVSFLNFGIKVCSTRSKRVRRCSAKWGQTIKNDVVMAPFFGVYAGSVGRQPPVILLISNSIIPPASYTLWAPPSMCSAIIICPKTHSPCTSHSGNPLVWKYCCKTQWFLCFLIKPIQKSEGNDRGLVFSWKGLGLLPSFLP